MSSTNAPRRPAGFRAPGPRPAGDLGHADLAPGSDEDLSYLAGDWRIFQPRRGHRWSLDDLLTAWVAADCVPAVARSVTDATAARSGHDLRFVDLGCGLGSVLMLMAWAFPDARVWGVEAQASRAQRARRSLRYNGAALRCEVVDGDLRELEHSLVPRLSGAPSVVTGTPPYFDPSATRRADDDETAGCRVELRGGLEVYLDAAARVMASDAVVVLCYPVAEGARAEMAGSERGLVLRRRLTVVPREGKTALIVVDVFRRETGVVEHHDLTVRTATGEWTEEFRAVRRRFGMPDGTKHARSFE